MSNLGKIDATKFEFDKQDEIEKKMSEDWVIIQALGKGGFGLVVSMYGKKVGCVRAVKI